jgi:probable rRNA maturation factor
MRIHLGDRQDLIAINRRTVRRLVRTSFPARQPGYDDINLVLVSDPEIRQLNVQYRARNRATDVLSFDLRGGPSAGMEIPRTGEVFVSTDSTVRQARSHRLTVGGELARLVIHGLLHLRGFDHRQAAERRVMRSHEAEILDRVQPLLAELIEQPGGSL